MKSKLGEKKANVKRKTFAVCCKLASSGNARPIPRMRDPLRRRALCLWKSRQHASLTTRTNEKQQRTRRPVCSRKGALCVTGSRRFASFEDRHNEQHSPRGGLSPRRALAGVVNFFGRLPAVWLRVLTLTAQSSSKTMESRSSCGKLEELALPWGKRGPCRLSLRRRYHD
jgi:hypothetical protein